MNHQPIKPSTRKFTDQKNENSDATPITRVESLKIVPKTETKSIETSKTFEQLFFSESFSVYALNSAFLKMQTSMDVVA